MTTSFDRIKSMQDLVIATTKSSEFVEANNKNDSELYQIFLKFAMLPFAIYLLSMIG